jgi:hypothetical protein
LGREPREREREREIERTGRMEEREKSIDETQLLSACRHDPSWPSREQLHRHAGPLDPVWHRGRAIVER